MAAEEKYHSRIVEKTRDHTDRVVVIEAATDTYDIGDTYTPPSEAALAGKVIAVAPFDPHGYETGTSRTVLRLRAYRAWS